MAEYIEREALNKVIDYEIEVCNSGIAKGALEMLKVRVEPAADVVEVVRCKDCRYYRAKNFPLFSGDCFYGVSGERTVFEEHYCSYGEWKMDKEE